MGQPPPSKLDDKNFNKNEGDTKAEEPKQETIVNTTADVQSYIKDQNISPEEFVKRLPPSKILRRGQSNFIAVNSDRNIDGLESFLKKGEQLMKSYQDKYLNEKIKEQQAILAEELKEKIISLAKDENFLEGRWLLFPSSDVVDDVWLKVVQNTITGHLGINAKIDRKVSDYVIRVYTKDFTNKADVLRVLKTLNDLELLDKELRYKCTAFSRLKIYKGNIFNIAPSIYRSQDFMKSQDDDDMCWLRGIKEGNESAESFVARLLPSKVFHSSNGFISLFKEESDIEYNKARCLVEKVGKMLLGSYKSQIEMTPIPKRSCLTKELQNKLTKLAVECNFVKGRWTCYAGDNIDFLWLKTVEGTMNGTLGINAKVQQKRDQQFEIKVITKDFNDEADVMRVLAEMNKLGLTPPFFYKPYIYTKLEIFKNNVYGLNPYLHVASSERPTVPQRKIDRPNVPQRNIERPKRDSSVCSVTSNVSENFSHGWSKCMEPNESPAEFVARCPPETTVVSHDGWISVGRKWRDVENIEKFKKAANELILTARACMEYLSSEERTSVTAGLMKNIDEIAVEHGIVEGKWMIFIPPRAHFVDKIWLDVVKAVVDGRFHGASISLKNYSKPDRSQVMNIVTKNYTDIDDVKRVLSEINKMGLMMEVLTYRCDAYHLLNLTRNNVLNVSPSIYKSDQFPDVECKRQVVRQPRPPPRKNR